jgi:hypothetical protein
MMWVCNCARRRGGEREATVGSSADDRLRQAIRVRQVIGHEARVETEAFHAGRIP